MQTFAQCGSAKTFLQKCWAIYQFVWEANDSRGNVHNTRQFPFHGCRQMMWEWRKQIIFDFILFLKVVKQVPLGSLLKNKIKSNKKMRTCLYSAALHFFSPILDALLKMIFKITRNTIIKHTKLTQIYLSSVCPHCNLGILWKSLYPCVQERAEQVHGSLHEQQAEIHPDDEGGEALLYQGQASPDRRQGSLSNTA